MSSPRSLPGVLGPGCLRSSFQPIIDVSTPLPSIHSFEVLTRGLPDTNFGNAAVLFEYVRRKRAEPAVDRECVKLGFSEVSRFAPGVCLSVNVHASSFARDPEMPGALAELANAHHIPASLVSVEIVEYMTIWGQKPFTHAMDKLRDYGFKIAIDDLGSGQSNFRMILETRPDYLKLDSYIIKGCSDDEIRRAIIDAVVSLASKFDCGVVAEGVENPLDLDALVRSGITLVQGYYFCRPVPGIELVPTLARFGCLQPVQKAETRTSPVETLG